MLTRFSSGSCNCSSCLQTVSRVPAAAVLAIAVAEQQPAVWGYVVEAVLL